MIMISRRSLYNTAVMKPYLTTKVSRNVPKLSANRVSSPMYNILFYDSIFVSFIFSLEKNYSCILNFTTT